MKCKLSDICICPKGKIEVANLDEATYISTENMLPNRGGVVPASGLPTIESTQAFAEGDVLVSNIRPYFKKIWQATFSGGCSNDVLVFRAKNGIDKDFLYYVLSDDQYFNYATATSKGTKMPRGDKVAIMLYIVPNVSHEEQCKIASILHAIDQKIQLNKEINHNLEQQIQALYTIYFVNTNNGQWLDVPLSKLIFFQEGPGIRNWQYVDDGIKFINIRCINNGCKPIKEGQRSRPAERFGFERLVDG